MTGRIGQDARLFACQKWSDQEWYVDFGDKGSGRFMIRNRHTGDVCLAVQGDAAVERLVVQLPCDERIRNQWWKWVAP
ncbi:hypothetical protein FHS42_001559 [Streptomyces zagrosensis]|uniref:Ricin B lectin domain-containing protein n=1 Tax=Streptomyces zagrosensis TaxID=1042984 RepID=A0A7W9Q868_9ACTN|nr:hypothetical protein [Streptomyces zagrosensis]